MTVDVVCLSTADWDAELWTNKQHLVSQLADAGLTVLYIDSLGMRAPGASAQDLHRIVRRLKAWRPTAREVRPGVLRDSPLVVPAASRAPVRALNRALLRMRLARNLGRGSDLRPVLWTYSPAAMDIWDPSRFSALVYHCVDDLAAYPGINADGFRRAESALIRAADVCVASSRPLVRHLELSGSRRTEYWPNPADVQRFSAEARARRDAVPGARPRVGFVGAVQEHKVDVELLIDVATARPEWDLVLVGPVGLGLAHSSMANVAWPRNVLLAGTASRDELPRVVAGFHAALIPYRLNAYTNGVFPMKVFEYLASGVGVVSTPLPSLAGEVDHVQFASTAEETIVQVERLLADDTPELRQLRMAYAAGHSWEARREEALELLREVGTEVTGP